MEFTDPKKAMQQMNAYSYIGACFAAHIFHGAPDIMIEAVPLVFNSDCECIIEKKLSTTEEFYQPNSRLPNQAGQLIAYLHQLIVVKGIHMAVNQIIVSSTFQTYGLYITPIRTTRNDDYCHILFST